MSDPARILSDLEAAGVHVTLEDDRLKVTGNQQAITAHLDEIRAHKPELVALLTQAANDAHAAPEPPIERFRRLNRETEASIEDLERQGAESHRKIQAALLDARIRASAETIGNALESSLIEGTEALAKIRPAADPAPLATASYGEVVAWMDVSGETDPEVRRDILIGYGFDPDFQYLDSGRRTCRQCRNLDADGGCRAARRGQIPNTSRHYTWPAGIDAPHRCVGYLPGPDDLDKRPGRERFDWPTAETQPDTAKAVCARCAHWTPNPVNAAGGIGRCTIAAPASKRPGSLWPWPDAEIYCTRFQEITPC